MPIEDEMCPSLEATIVCVEAGLEALDMGDTARAEKILRIATICSVGCVDLRAGDYFVAMLARTFQRSKRLEIAIDELTIAWSAT